MKSVWPDWMGNLWLATHGKGLIVFNETAGVAGHFTHRGRRGDLPGNDLNCVYGDSRGKIWVATQGGGVARFDPVAQHFTTWTTREGLANNLVYGVLEEDANTLWFSTLNGLSRFSQKDNAFKNYSFGSGLPLEETNEGAFYRASGGEFVAGGKNGYVRFTPGGLRDNAFIPPVLITNLLLSNTPVTPGDGTGILDRDISATRELTLDYFESVVTFEFAALSFLRPENNQYAYRLEGFDEDWTLAGNKRSVTYTNLPDGEYVFLVKGSNNDGVWNSRATGLRIRVLLPPWKTGWAYGLYALVIAGGFWVIRHNALKSAQLKHELRMEQFEKEKWKEIHQLKLEYFTDVSHEIRTPLTLIYNPLQQLMQSDEGSPRLRKQLEVMYASCSRLLRLVDQILEIRRLESGKTALHPSAARVDDVVGNVVQSFQGLAEQKNIRLRYVTPPDPQRYLLDVDKTEKVFYNLLSNAFKFTADGGAIEIRSRCLSRGAQVYYVFKVYDTGRGIAADQLDKIFDRFYKENKHSAGSGIGLAHTKSLVELCGGRISVRSKPGAGTCFTVVLPLTVAGEAEGTAALPVRPLSSAFALAAEAPAVTAPDRDETVVLLAEDNEELREYLAGQLAEKVQVVAVPSGEEALERLAGQPVDLVITDIMMDAMTGLELCAAIKHDLRLCHIPVILLTARGADVDRIGGYRTGADDYITKPFITEELLARMDSLLANRKRIHQLYGRQTRLEPKQISVNGYDEKLLEKIVAYLEANLSESDLTVEQIGEEVGLSRVHLYRKIKALTGLTTSDFIKDFRLKRAAQLLQTRKLKVAEVAYQVGFADVHYFSKCFKKAYGMSPTSFAEAKNPYQLHG